MQDEAQETWRNASRGWIFLKQYDWRGEIKDAGYASGKLVHIMPKERRLNQEMAANDGLDVFRNGRLVPIVIDETSDEGQFLLSSPNILSEEAMQEVFLLKSEAFMERVNTITNVPVIQRALEVADELDATVQQVRVLTERFRELNPSLVVEHDFPV